MPAVLVHLLLEWNIPVHFNSDTVNFAWKTDEGEGRGQTALFCYILFFGVALLVGG